MEEKKDKQGIRTFIVSAVIFVVTVAGTGLCSFIFGQEMHYIIRNSVTAGLGAGVIICLMSQAKEKNLYDYDNSRYCERFLLCYLVAILTAFICGKLPSSGWPFLPIFVLLALFSNYIIGICAGSLFLMISIMLSGATVEIFFLYFISGVIAVCVFNGLDEKQSNKEFKKDIMNMATFFLINDDEFNFGEITELEIYQNYDLYNFMMNIYRIFILY